MANLLKLGFVKNTGDQMIEIFENIIIQRRRPDLDIAGNLQFVEINQDEFRERKEIQKFKRDQGIENEFF